MQAIHEALSRGRLGEAELAIAALPAGSADADELGWLAARARHEPRPIARAATRWCGRDRTGRACADAELYRRVARAPAVALERAVELPLSTTAPFPLMLASAGGAGGGQGGVSRIGGGPGTFATSTINGTVDLPGGSALLAAALFCASRGRGGGAVRLQIPAATLTVHWDASRRARAGAPR